MRLRRDEEHADAVPGGVSMRALLIATTLVIGCGDAPTGADRCGGKCKGHEQCSLTKVELSGPACYPATSCTAYGFACVDPADVHIMSLDETPQQ